MAVAERGVFHKMHCEIMVFEIDFRISTVLGATSTLVCKSWGHSSAFLGQAGD